MSQKGIVMEPPSLNQIAYADLNTFQRKRYNFEKIAERLANHGFRCTPCKGSNADFIASHVDGKTFLKVRQTNRFLVDKKYLGKDLHIAFRSGDHHDDRDDVYVYPHDIMVEKITEWGKIKGRFVETESWKKRGMFNWRKATKEHLAFLQPYRFDARHQIQNCYRPITRAITSQKGIVMEPPPLNQIAYADLNSFQRKHYNFQKITDRLASHGFRCTPCKGSSADFIASHVDGKTFLKVQQVGCFVVNKKYLGKNLHIAFRSGDHHDDRDDRDDVYVYPHDIMVEKITEWGKIRGCFVETESSKERGMYFWNKPTTELLAFLQPYRFDARPKKWTSFKAKFI